MGTCLFYFWNRLPPQLPWFYSLPWGETQLIDKKMFAAFLVGLLSVFGITHLLSSWFSKNDEVAKTVMLLGGVALVTLYAAGFGRVIQIFIR